MKTYINPNTTILSVATQTIICASEIPNNGADPATAQAPARRIDYFKF